MTQTELIAAQIKSERGITDLEFLAAEIQSWLDSTSRKTMLTAKDYYSGKHDILSRKRTVIGRDGNSVSVNNLPNNVIIDNRYARFVDQKKNYLFGKPLTFICEDSNYTVKLRGVLGNKFLRTLKLAGEEAINAGISWLYPYLNELGEMGFKLFSGSEICPFWADSAHTELDCAARVYTSEIYEGKSKREITRVELFNADGISSFELKGKELIAYGETSSYLSDGVDNYNWARLPLVAIKANSKETALISRVRQLQDALNLILSDFVNNMEENVHNTVLVLKNYDGTDLGEFRKNLATYGAIKTRTVEGASGGVDTLNIDVNCENYRTVIDLLKKAITENARGFDSRDERFSGTPNQLNIMSMYSDIDLDANDMESEMQAAFEDILWFVNQYLSVTSEKLVQVIFNRDILINESEAIENCVKSKGVISDETIIAEHPWTLDPSGEISRLRSNAMEGQILAAETL